MRFSNFIIHNSCFILLVMAVFPANVAKAEPFNAPSIPDGEVREFGVRRIDQKGAGVKSLVRPGEELDHFSVKTVWKTGAQGREMEVIRDEARSRGHHCVHNYTFSVRGKYIFSRTYSIEIRSPDGRLLRSEKGSLWYPKGEPPPDLVHAIAISEAIRGYNFREGAKTDARLWNADGGDSPRMELTVAGAESLTLPAGKYRAWRVNMEMDLKDLLGRWKGIEFLIKMLMPGYTYWFADMPSHPLVNFQGQFGPKTSAPIEIHELTKMIP